MYADIDDMVLGDPVFVKCKDCDIYIYYEVVITEEFIARVKNNC